MNDEDFENLDLPYEERWENLTLANDFLFGKIFQDTELCLELVQIILPDLNIKRITNPLLQKNVRETFESRGVRFDVYVEDDANRVINIEMQTMNRDNIRKRTRIYHSYIDIDVLDRYDIRKYDDIPEAIVIFICDFGVFDSVRHFYEFRNICVQERDLFLDDGGRTIFLSTKGKADDISPKLKNFLNLVRGITSQDSFVKKLEKKLKYAKQNAVWRRQYMLAKIERLALIDEAMARGRLEGKAEGRLEGRAEGRLEGRAEGRLEGKLEGKAEGIAIGEKRGSIKTLDTTTLILKDAGIDPAIIEKLRLSILGSQ